jgi:hypothetical protein
MRIASGTSDQYVYFKAVDVTDRVTPETGLTEFTVYRSRDGAAAAAMTTPTTNEIDATNMPGIYGLLLDEDMTVGAGNVTEAMAFHITEASMDPVTIEIELFVPPPTNAEFEARTLDTADYATAAAASTTDGKVDSILADTDELQSDDVPGLIAALHNFDPANDVVANVTLVATTTANTDMRGTDSAATAAALTAVGADVTDIKASTDQIVFTKAGEIDANTQSINDAGVTGDGNAIPWRGE